MSDSTSTLELCPEHPDAMPARKVVRYVRSAQSDLPVLAITESRCSVRGCWNS